MKYLMVFECKEGGGALKVECEPSEKKQEVKRAAPFIAQILEENGWEMEQPISVFFLEEGSEGAKEFFEQTKECSPRLASVAPSRKWNGHVREETVQ